MSLLHLPPTVSPHDVADHLRTYGYAIVDDAIGSGVLDRLDVEAAPFIDRSAGGRDDYDGRFTRRTGSLVARCPAARELIMHDLIVNAVRQFLDHATAVQLHLTQIISIEPGESRQKLHRDQMAFDFFPFPPDYHVQCNTMWALTDFTEENGATHVLAGTSGLTDDIGLSMVDAQATMRRGSVLLYDGKVLHGGGANRSTVVRRGVNITYSVGWVRQEENQFVACPPEVARTLPDDLLRMMGYQQGAFALGYVGDQQDPLAVLRDGDSAAVKVKVIGDIAHTDDHRRFVDELGA